MNPAFGFWYRGAENRRFREAVRKLVSIYRDDREAARHLEWKLINECSVERALAVACDVASDLESAVGRAREMQRDHALPRTASRDLERALAAARAARTQFADLANLPVVEMIKPVEPTPVATRLATAAVTLLPAPHRQRYAEEFRSELFEIAASKCSRLRQVAYGVRTLRQVLRLRAELRNVRL